jgi:hypothetical protein
VTKHPIEYSVVYITGMMSASLTALASEPGFPPDVEIATIADYVVPLPAVSLELLPNFDKLHLAHLAHIREQLRERIASARSVLERARSPAPHRSLAPLDTFDGPIALRRRCQVLLHLLEETEPSHMTSKRRISEDHLRLFEQLLLFCEYLITSPRPFFIRVIPPDFEAAIHDSNRETWRTVQRLRLAFNESYTHLNLHPRATFSSRTQNTTFLLRCISSAVSSRRAGTSYFEEIPEESRARAFFASPSSPLSVIAPHAGTPDSVAQWVRASVAALVQYIGGAEAEVEAEAEGVLSVLLARFVFEFEFERRAAARADDLSGRREHIRGLCPRDVPIVDRYVPAECAERPVTRMFAVSSIARAPLDWLQIAGWRVCPLDIAYAVFKTHEALTKMATLEATRNLQSQEAQAFFERMPGFDDIFGHWVALVAVSDLPDPKEVVEFVNEWARLPGFPQRFLACCAYLEAAVRQIETFGQEEEEEG